MGLNLLHHACGANQLEVVKVLLKAKCIDVNIVSSPVNSFKIYNSIYICVISSYIFSL